MSLYNYKSEEIETIYDTNDEVLKNAYNADGESMKKQLFH